MHEVELKVGDRVYYDSRVFSYGVRKSNPCITSPYYCEGTIDGVVRVGEKGILYYVSWDNGETNDYRKSYGCLLPVHTEFTGL